QRHMPLAAADERPRLVPARRAQRAQALAFRPHRRAGLAEYPRGFWVMLVAFLVPLNVPEEIQELPMAAVRAGYRCAPLIRFLVGIGDAAFILDCRRAGAHREPVRTEAGGAFLRQRDRIAFAGNRILVDLVGKQHT